MSLCMDGSVGYVNGSLVVDGDGNALTIMIPDNFNTPPNCNFILMEQFEYNDIQASLANGLLSLTLADGALIAGAILAVWATGYAIRLLIRVLKHTDENISP